jgi:hypothetical protein
MTNTNAFIVSRPIHTPLEREPRPAQYALGGSALEWQGYREACARMQRIAAHQESMIKGPELRSEPIAYP